MTSVDVTSFRTGMLYYYLAISDNCVKTIGVTKAQPKKKQAVHSGEMHRALCWW